VSEADGTDILQIAFIPLKAAAPNAGTDIGTKI
jgi:hypothetical protein